MSSWVLVGAPDFDFGDLDLDLNRVLVKWETKGTPSNLWAPTLCAAKVRHKEKAGWEGSKLQGGERAVCARQLDVVDSFSVVQNRPFDLFWFSPILVFP